MSAAATAELPRDRANREQLAASDPAVSTFVGASAGSGKTKLLTDRLLRLMLSGAKPERIQCLTFTKAAAAEMALRLQARLGRWVTCPEHALADELRSLGVEPTPATRGHARALFAKVLDLPGGMRIGTIHAFCQSLLRRFPLEAALSPHFQLVDEHDAEDALIEAREDMLAGAHHTDAMQTALRTLAGLASADQFGRHVEALQTDRDRLAMAVELGDDLAAAQRRALRVGANSRDAIIAGAVNWQGERALRLAAENVARDGSPMAREKAVRVLEWLGLDAADRAEHWDRWREEFFRDGGERRGDGAFVNKKLAEAQPDLLDAFRDECGRIEEVEDSCRALRVAEISAALLTLAAPVLQSYAAHKERSGLVDYDDLIGRTSQLLVDPGAAWVLYKLDGGLDHLLLDEAQDTAPAQWRIAHALTGEFFAGAGAVEAERTVFAVGDRKQSIYSFQGADVDAFGASRARLKSVVTRAWKAWRDTALDVSFRSTKPVLALVDQVFADPAAAAGVVEDGRTLAHYADRSEAAGAVELWPLTPVPDAPAPQDWTVPDSNQGLTSAPQRLADTLADWILGQTSGAVMLESRGRPVTPGDVLVLVRRRNAFARALVRALKARGVPVAGLDRLVLTEQPAVQDLLALADALLLPQDDLTFACLLTSPLGGLSDDDLMQLAVGRDGALFEALRQRAAERPHWRRAWDCFAKLLARVDYVSPYALFAEALGPLGGRARLYARLGPEAAEPVDELLNTALAYARTHPPSLQGFVHWLRRAGAEVKREAEAAGNQVRVMTVHGAKGLQAPLVILPDTTAIPPDEGAILWAEDPVSKRVVPLFSPRKEFRCTILERTRGDLARRRMEEHNRLLYVAVTRAEDRLVVCGWQTARPLPDMCWYNLVSRGFAGLSPEREAFQAWDGDVMRVTSPQRAEVKRPAGRVESGAAVLPGWLSGAPDWRSSALPLEPLKPERLAPSKPEGVELGPVPAAASPLADGTGRRFVRGRLLHALLQHLPELPAAERASGARRWLERPGHGLADGEATEIASEALAILARPELAPLFGPESRAEVPLTGVIGDSVVGGLVDRLAVLPDQVLVADFKTNRRAPDKVENTPVTYLRQMAAYRAVLREIFADRPVHCALIWTRVGRVALLPDDLLDRHEPMARTQGGGAGQKCAGRGLIAEPPSAT